MKTISILKAALSQDMNIFKYTTKRNSSTITKIMFPIIFFGIVCFSIGTYANFLAKELSSYHQTNFLLVLFIAIVTVLTIIEGIYKSQGILFDAKDNDLLFSLPIKKSQILFVRIFKLLLFQYIYNLMFLLPATIVYIHYENPAPIFYPITILMTILIPIIPTIFSSIIGYIIKLLSSKSNSQKIVQTILSSIVFLGIFYLSLNLQNYFQVIVSKASDITKLLTTILYPLKLYLNLITKFNILDLIILITLNIVPFIIFIYLGSISYFKIIYTIANHQKHQIKNNNKEIIKQRSPLISLTIKEIKRYLSSPVYMFNTSLGLLIVVIITILTCVKGVSVINKILSLYNLNTTLSLPVLFHFLVFFSTTTTSITSSSISLEGKTINITKSLPIDIKTILKSKILSCYTIELPFIIISELIFFIKFTPKVTNILLTISIGIITILLTACIGLLANLKYPKMNASSDTEVVKQSMSSIISVFLSIAIFFLSIILIIYLTKYLDINLILLLHLLILTIIAIFLYYLLMKIGPKEYQKINV